MEKLILRNVSEALYQVGFDQQDDRWAEFTLFGKGASRQDRPDQFKKAFCSICLRAIRKGWTCTDQYNDAEGYVDVCCDCVTIEGEVKQVGRAPTSALLTTDKEQAIRAADQVYHAIKGHYHESLYRNRYKLDDPETDRLHQALKDAERDLSVAYSQAYSY